MSALKDQLRRAAVMRRAEVHGVANADPALERLARELQRSSGPVSFYWPIRSEIDPRPVMEAMAGLREVCLPVTHGREAALSFRRWTPGAAMEADGFGVMVPAVNVPVVPQVLVVPLLAFDDHCHRLGYGAGHYDRTLAELRPNGPVTALGFAYAAQRESEPLPIEPTDQPLDAIVTEYETLLPVASSETTAIE